MDDRWSDDTTGDSPATAPPATTGMTNRDVLPIPSPDLPPRRDSLPVADPLRRMPGLIAIDLEGVLYEDSSWERWVYQLLCRLGVQTTFLQFQTVWRRDYLARVSRGEVGVEQTLRSFLAAMGLPAGTVCEVCAATLGRLQRSIARPMLIPGSAGLLRQLTQHNVPMLATHHGCRSNADWSTTLARWRIGNCFQAVVAWPDADTHHRAESATVPRELRASASAWYVSADPVRCRLASESGVASLVYGIACGGEQPTLSCLSELRQYLRSARPAHYCRSA